MHNKALEGQMNVILAGLNIALDELYVHQEEVEKMCVPSDQAIVQAEIDKHLEIVEDAKDLVREWAHRLDQSVPSTSF